MPELSLCRTSRVLFVGLCAWMCFGSDTCLQAQTPPKEDFAGRAKAQVEANEKIKPNLDKARNIILFVGDGMGVTTVTAARIRDGQLKGSPLGGEENELSFEKFPHLAHSKTYQANQQVPDSAPTMTSIVTGTKTNDGMLSVDPAVKGSGNFKDARDPKNRLTTILEQAEERNMWTGVVSTARITHATPAACYAHTPNRDWESDGELSVAAALGGFPDIASQLVDFKVKATTMNGHASQGLELAFGGGRSKFIPTSEPDPEDQGRFGERVQRNLVQEWVGRGGAFVWNQSDFNALDPKKTGPVLALFERSHMEYELDRANDKGKEPSLAEMTEKAISILENSPKGFFLMIEAGRIDHAHHGGNAIRALQEAIELSLAVEKAAAMVGDDTLIIVTADHSHTFTMSGYPTRGNPILGLVITNEDATSMPAKEPVKAKDGKPYTTLGYANGPGAVLCGERSDLKGAKTDALEFLQQALVPMDSETHGGEDVAIYARGPQAYLFQGTMEENAIYWVMARALGIWP